MSRLVILESPYAATATHTVEDHVRYARACMKDCLSRGEAPFASHLLYTQRGVLDDTKPEERNLGIGAGLEWKAACTATVVYMDLGLTPGMELGIENAAAAGNSVTFRRLGWSK